MNIKNIPIILAIVILGVVLLAGWQVDKTPVSIESFNDCVLAGNPVKESYPRQCTVDGKTFIEDVSAVEDIENNIEDVEIKCTPEQKQADVCTQVYQPVCASVRVECIKAPCNPIKQTFSNQCTACSAPRVLSYTPGECSSE